MSEYIITDEQIAENRRLHGRKLLVMPVIVRCRDCKHSTGGGTCCWQFAHDELDGFGDWVEVPADVEPDGYCAWGRKNLDDER